MVGKQNTRGAQRLGMRRGIPGQAQHPPGRRLAVDLLQRRWWPCRPATVASTGRLVLMQVLLLLPKCATRRALRHATARRLHPLWLWWLLHMCCWGCHASACWAASLLLLLRRKQLGGLLRRPRCMLLLLLLLLVWALLHRKQLGGLL